MLAEQVLHHGRAAAIRHLHRRHLCRLGEERGGEMPARARTGMRHAEGVGSQVRDQLAERGGRERLAPDEHQRVMVDEAHRRDVAFGVVRQLAPVEPRIRRDLQVVHEQRVAVGRRAREPVRGDDRVAAAHVLDHEGLAELLVELRRELARDLVGRPSRREGNDDGHRLGRILLGEGDGTPER